MLLINCKQAAYEQVPKRSVDNKLFEILCARGIYQIRQQEKSSAPLVG